jgi:hypothetical protein
MDDMRRCRHREMTMRPMVLAGLGVGALAPQLGSVTGSLPVLAVIALIALYFTRKLPTKQPASTAAT